MEEISDTLCKLNITMKENKTSDVEEALATLTKQLPGEGTSKKASLEHLTKNGLVDTFRLILRNRVQFSASTVASVAEILADIAKLDSGRKVCSDSAIIVPLLELLSNNDPNVVMQVCRALGNICYDNDAARSLVKENNGIDRLIQLLRNLLEKENLPEQMRMITSGCLLNLTDAYEEIQEEAVEAGIVDVLVQYLMKFNTDTDVVAHCFLVLSYLADTSKGRTKIFEKTVLSNLLSLLDKPLSDEILDSLLSFFGYLSDSDAEKLTLAQMGLCEKLLDIVNEYLKSGNVVNDIFNVCKTVSDLLILILNGDESMVHLWNDGQGVVYKESLSWLKCSDENLCIAGALVVGNFARKDSHCIKMLTDGVVEELKTLLEQHSGQDGGIGMQHAVLSALKNLSIPAENKAAMVNLGLESLLMNMMAVKTFPVVFKLLGTLRMLVKQQGDVATTVGENTEFLKRLVSSCNATHPGVRGEACRLLAWIATYSMSISVWKNLIEVNALPPLSSMLKSEHVIMQKEGLVALNLIASGSIVGLNCVADEVASSDLVNNLHQLLKNSIHTPELTNVLCLIHTLATSDKIKSQLNKTSICSDLTTLKSQTDDNKELATKVLEILAKNP